jgi:predicted ATPase
MFPEYKEVVLKDDLSSLGYSGSWVYRVHLLRRDESPELPLVVKLAPAGLITKEVHAYQECVRNQWPGIAELRGDPVYLEGSDLGGLCYPLMGGGVFRMQSLREYCLEASTEDVCFVLRERLFRLMQERMLRPARNVFEHPLRASYDRVLPVNLLVEPGAVGQTQGIEPTLVAPDALPHSPLQPGDVVRLEGFVVSEVNPRQRSVTLNVPADRMRNAYRLRLCPVEDLSAYAVGEVMPPADGVVRETRQSLLHKELAKTFGPGLDPACETVALSGDDDDSRVILPNPLLSIPDILSETRHVKVNAIHGDLNLENVLVDPQVRDVRLIDFAEARRDHVLHDFLRLETEVVTKVLSAVLAEAELSPEAVVHFYGRLHYATFQHDPGRIPALAHPALEKPFAILTTIRRTARDGLYDRDDLGEYYEGLTLYLMGALKFGNLNAVSKQTAFWGAATLQQLMVELSEHQAFEEQHSFADALTAALSTSFPRTRPGNLPARLTPFIGRELEMAAIQERLQDPACRLLTLLGPGGSGKTRLAQEVAADPGPVSQQDAFTHGVYYVPMASFSSTQAIVPGIARALSFSFYEGLEPLRQLKDFLSRKSMLLVLDNFDHLLGGVDLVTDILKAAPGVKVLVTSRERLNVQGEHLFPVGGMDVPVQTPAAPETLMASAAVELFLYGARQIQPAFGPTGEDLAHIVRICRLVQGMPLGILLAASWVQMLSPAAIADEIERSIDFLETDSRDMPERQRSLRAVFDYSWDLLADRERQVFQRLSVFRGSFARKAAQRVAGASLRELRHLANKSLLHSTSSGRYEIHGLLSQYVAEKLEQSPDAGRAVRDRYSDYYAAALREWGTDLQGPRQQVAMAEMDVEIENARTAWDWMVDQGYTTLLGQAMDGLSAFYHARLRGEEGESACRAAVDRPTDATLPADLIVLAKALAWLGVFGWMRGHTEPPIRLLEKSLCLLDRPELSEQDTRPARAFALYQMGVILHASDREQANRLYETSLALYRSIGDRWGEATALEYLGWVASDLGEFERSQELYQASLEIRRRLGDHRGIASLLNLLGTRAVCLGRFEEGDQLIRESTAIYQELGDMAGVCDGLRESGFALFLSGRLSEAHVSLQQSMEIADELGHRWQLAHTSLLMGFAMVLLGRYEQAQDTAQRGLVLSREVGYQRGMGLALLLLGCLAVVEAEYDSAQQLLQESVAIYRALRQQHELGQAYAALAYAERGLKRPERARCYLAPALQIGVEIGAPVPLMLALPVVALLMADRGEVERAIELYALASSFSVMSNSLLFEDVAGKHIATVSAALAPEKVVAAKERGRSRDLWTTAAELLDELRRSPG